MAANCDQAKVTFISHVHRAKTARVGTCSSTGPITAATTARVLRVMRSYKTVTAMQTLHNIALNSDSLL